MHISPKNVATAVYSLTFKHSKLAVAVDAVLTPILAGEPHRLTFSHVTTGASCGGQYFWYDINQPNRQPLHSPADTFVQLIFAGGKDTLNGADINPFISQQVSGDQIAIDPTYGLDEGSTTSSAPQRRSNRVPCSGWARPGPASRGVGLGALVGEQ